MIDGYKCYRTMGSLEQIRWQKAVVLGDNILNNKYWNFREFLASSFIWGDTKEGFEYWDWVSTKYIIHDLLTPQTRWQTLPPCVWPVTE